MLKTERQNWIHNVRVKWITFNLIVAVAGSLAISLVLTAIGLYILSLSAWLFAFTFVLSLFIFLFIKPVWKITNLEIARYANNKIPELEESADLILKNPQELSMLQQLQRDKIQSILFSTPHPPELSKRLYTGLGVLIVGILISFGISKIPHSGKTEQHSQNKGHNTAMAKENIPVGISSFSATIIPPAYTAKRERRQKQFSINAETGSKVIWKIETGKGPRALKIIFNDKEIVFLKPTNKDSTNWTYSKNIDRSGFYQLELDGKKSDLYQIGAIPDLPVTIKINQPKQHTTIDIGQPTKVRLNVSLSDDYGIYDASILTTMARGKGEGVSFTERIIPFNASFGNKRNMVLSQLIDLNSLGMKPGDELYFFVKAMDNHGQSSRSDVYFVSIVDTTELMSMAGMASGVNLVPEYFRSQRQIIIDTDKLLKEKNSLSAEAFKTRSNELGVDQKLLRLRYGQFLGEENETEIGGDHDEHEEHEGHSKEEKFGDVTAIMDKYAHKHDIAEDATFFEPEMKAQLKAVLTEMWNSELRLRTYKPQEALPYEYKALRLLKDLQQKSRAYVAKTTVKTAALKPEKRLSGDLDKITQPVQKMSFEEKEQRITQLKTTLALLENRKTGKPFTSLDQYMLRDTEKYMIGAAADHPATYLNSLSGIRRLATGSKLLKKDIDIVQQAIQKMIRNDQAKPQAQTTLPASALYQNYFNNLKKSR